MAAAGASFAQGFSTFLQCFKPKAIQQFTEYLERYPDDFESRFFRGISYGIINDVKSAIADFTEAAKHGNPGQNMVANAQRLLHEGKVTEAGSTLLQSIQSYPTNPIGWHFYGSLLHSCSVRDDTTVAAFQKAIELRFRQAALSHYYVGEIMASKGKHAAAAEHMREALRLNPTFTLAHIGLGNALTETGRAEEALSSLLRALELNDTQIQAHKGLAAAYQKLGNSEAAREHTEKYEKRSAATAAPGRKGGDVTVKRPNGTAAREHTEEIGRAHV